jgi:hypothetical protein
VPWRRKGKESRKVRVNMKVQRMQNSLKYPRIYICKGFPTQFLNAKHHASYSFWLLKIQKYSASWHRQRNIKRTNRKEKQLRQKNEWMEMWKGWVDRLLSASHKVYFNTLFMLFCDTNISDVIRGLNMLRIYIFKVLYLYFSVL